MFFSVTTPLSVTEMQHDLALTNGGLSVIHRYERVGNKDHNNIFSRGESKYVIIWCHKTHQVGAESTQRHCEADANTHFIAGVNEGKILAH